MLAAFFLERIGVLLVVERPGCPFYGVSRSIQGYYRSACCRCKVGNDELRHRYDRQQYECRVVFVDELRFDHDFHYNECCVEYMD